MTGSRGAAGASSEASRATVRLREAAAAGDAALAPAEMLALLAHWGIDAADPHTPGDALRLGLKFTPDFGFVLSAGAAAVEPEPVPAASRTGLETLHVATALTDADDFLEALRGRSAYCRFAARAAPAPPDAAVGACVGRLLAVARDLDPQAGAMPRTIDALALDLVWSGSRLEARAAQCAFGAAPLRRPPRPLASIDRLLHPQRIGIIGVSASGMNFGRIILRNLMGGGYPPAQLCVIRAGETAIDGVACVAGLAALDAPLDLLIVAVAADAVYGLVDEILATRAAHAVMLIPGGLGETERSREPAAALAQRIDAARAASGGGPIFLGANCLGVVSHPGGYDSWFIPLERLPKPRKKPERTAVMLSQSGAFMITRLSQNPWLDPRYLVAVGNQTDLTHGDLLAYFAELDHVETIGVYVEGFRDGDGLEFARAVRRAVLAGRQVVVYKAGKTAAGARAARGHTGMIAGPIDVCESVLRHAGAIIAEDFTAFDDLFYIAGVLHAKTIGGARIGAVSGAGFEAVGMADSIAADTIALELPEPAPATRERVAAVLRAKKLDALVEIRNPIDINPGADDEAHLDIVAAFLEDPDIDAVVVGLDPTAPAMRALAQSALRPGYDIQDPAGTVQRLPALAAAHAKPIVGIIDAGRLYDPMADGLMDAGVCVFRNCARGTRALARYIEARRYAERLRAATVPRPGVSQ